MTQELSDRVCERAYRENPTLMFELCEQERHLIHSYEVDGKLRDLIRDIKQAKIFLLLLVFDENGRHDWICSSMTRPRGFSTPNVLSGQVFVYDRGPRARSARGGCVIHLLYD